MKKNKLIFISITLFLTSLLFNKVLFAQAEATNSNAKNHIIVLMDRSGSMDNFGSSKKDIQNIFNTIIPNLINNSIGIKNDDYLSFVSFGLNKNNPDGLMFIEINDEVVNKYGFKYKYFGEIKDTLYNNFNNYTSKDYLYFFRKNWSGISFAKEVVLNFLQNDTISITNTYIILVSDGEFNAPNPSDEITKLKENGVTNTKYLLDIWTDITKKFTFDPISDSTAGEIKVKLYKLIPSLNNFNISRLVEFGDFNEKILINKTPLGYTFNNAIIDFLPDDPNLTIEKCTVTLLDENNNIVDKDVLPFPENKYEINFNNRIFKNNDKLKKINFEFDIRITDGTYNAFVISSDAMAKNQKKHFQHTINIEYEKGGNIFWLFKINDDMYKLSSNIMGSNIVKNTVFWNVLIAIILAIVLFFVFLKYVNKNKKDTNTDSVTIS